MNYFLSKSLSTQLCNSQFGYCQGEVVGRDVIQEAEEFKRKGHEFTVRRNGGFYCSIYNIIVM